MAIYKNPKSFELSMLEVGDYVTYPIVVAVVTGFGLIKPRILLCNLAQGGYPVTMKNPYTRKRREVYYTFLPSRDGLWEYKGQCFFFDWEHPQTTHRQLEIQGV